ncbi:EAL domain-containing protein [Halobacillus seohaensis]|uniref:EAL domain-containing protein n=1 Tax=Halobacillus seohaensis TaxID=447421 RepID=A0ABW2EN92_9BACI
MAIPSHFINENTIKAALERNEFQVYYQPKVNLATGEVIGAEALVRWIHPEYGTISPGEFIPLAESSGLIIPIGEWVLMTACQQLKKWQDLIESPFTMSVNLSVRQVYQPDLIEMIRRIIEETGIDSENLELEITESMMLDIDFAYTILREFKNIGVQISLDDFGKGYSSLLYLKKFPLDKIKIDQSFIKNCSEDTNDATLLKTIIVMAHQLNFQVVAEGVENREHLVFLQRNLCDEAQGFLFSKPIPGEEFMEKEEMIGQIVQQNGLPSDVFNKNWMEEELRMARQELLDTVRQQQGMIFKFVERSGQFVHTLCDGELLNRLGLASEMVVGRALHDFLPAVIADEKVPYYKRAWNGEDRVTYERESNGVHYISSLRPIRRRGQVVEVIGSCIDITDRKKAEEALKISEEKYRFIAENISDLVKIVNVDGVVEYASPSHQTMLGHSPEKYKGETLFNYIHPNDQDYVLSAFNKLLAT